LKVKSKARIARKQPRRVVARKPTRTRVVARSKLRRTSKPAAKVAARPAAGLAARVLSRRAEKVARESQPTLLERPALKLVPRVPAATKGRAHRGQSSRSGHAGSPGAAGNRQVVRVARVPTFNYMRAPGADSGFDVGDTVEVFCDHEQDSERVRGWVKGTVVQVDNKLVAVQFRSNVFLTDGWMVPDRILWYSVGSDQIRSSGVAKKGAHRVIPDY
jgi:hypothetical protein